MPTVEPMSPLERFAMEAALYQQWSRHGTEQGGSAVREALLRISSLYLAALELPAMDVTFDRLDAERVGDEEWQAVFTGCSRLPIDYYGEVSEPLTIPPGESGIGSIADDVADIYRDVVTGLRAFQAGHRQQAQWEWGSGFREHWGNHATSALRALHAWLVMNEPESSGPVDSSADSMI